MKTYNNTFFYLFAILSIVLGVYNNFICIWYPTLTYSEMFPELLYLYLIQMLSLFMCCFFYIESKKTIRDENK